MRRPICLEISINLTIYNFAQISFWDAYEAFNFCTFCITIEAETGLHGKAAKQGTKSQIDKLQMSDKPNQQS